MNPRIDELLNKYWDAETSIAEEQELKTYFSSSEVVPEHESYRPMFQWFTMEQEKGISLETALEKVNQEIDSQKTSSPVKVIRMRKWGLSIAASIVMIFSAIAVWNNYADTTQQSFAYTEIEDPDEALEVTLEALAFLTGKMNDGTGSVKEKMDKVTSKTIFK
jgi:hypothetical protein